jgi:hypothetical protein
MMGILRASERLSSGRPCDGSEVAMIERVTQNKADKSDGNIDDARAGIYSVKPGHAAQS